MAPPPAQPHYMLGAKSNNRLPRMTPDAPLDDNPEIDQGPPPKLVFFAALIANGWFLKVKAFAYNPGVASVPKRFMAAYARWIIFFAFWYGALQLLPTLAVLPAGFSAWLAWIVYDIRRAMRGQCSIQAPIRPLTSFF